MCGLLGAYSERINETAFRKAVNMLIHRGPDFQDIYSDGKMLLGHTRLAIIDLTEEANQPYIDGANDVVICFNGEIYNFKKDRKSVV